jgi:transposase
MGKVAGMRDFKLPQRSQQLLFAHIDLNTIAPIGSPLYVIDTFVEQLDTSKMEAEYHLESVTGRLPFHPKTLLKVALYALHNCRFSLRKMEYDTQYHLGYRWLTGDETIDHTTMGKFLSKHKLSIAELFSQIVMLGAEKGLIDFDILAIDTVKIRANASYKHFRNLEGLEKERIKIKEKISELMNDVLVNNEDEIKQLKLKELFIESAAEELKQRIKDKTVEAKESEVAAVTKKEKINLTDFDCQLVQQANGEKNSGYCITTATDSGKDFITGFKLNDNNDAKILIETIESSFENTVGEHQMVVADSGFSSIENLETLEENEQKALIPDRRLEVEKLGKTKKGEYDRCKFKYNENKDEYKCPAGKKLAYEGSYENKGRTYNKYQNKAACLDCPHRDKCTKAENRIIVRDTNEKIKEEMREKLNKKRNQKIYSKRAHTAETPFGQVKHNLKFRIFMRRGVEKIMMECALLFSLHNILKLGKIENS